MKLVLESPNAFAPDMLSLYQGRMLPSMVDESRLALEEFGTGPFRTTEHKPNESTVFERDPDYRDALGRSSGRKKYLQFGHVTHYHIPAEELQVLQRSEPGVAT